MSFIKSYLFVTLIVVASFSANVISWVPTYGIDHCLSWDGTGTLTQDFGGVRMKDGLTHLALQFWNPEPSNGSIYYGTNGGVKATNAIVKRFKDWGNANDVKVMLCVYNADDEHGNWNWERVRPIIESASRTNTFVNNLVNAMESHGLDGIEVDLEYMHLRQTYYNQNEFLAFMQKLITAVHNKGKEVTVATYAADWSEPQWNWWNSMVSYGVDGITSMGYEEIGKSGSGWSGYDGQKTKISDPQKLMLGMPGNKSSWKGDNTLSQVTWATNNDVGVGIWDATLSNSSWKSSSVWNKLKAIKDANVPAVTYTINATKGGTGSGAISESGNIVVTKGDDKTFTFTPAASNQIDSVMVGGVNVGNGGTYTFSNISNDKTINVFFGAINLGTSTSNGTGWATWVADKDGYGSSLDTSGGTMVTGVNGDDDTAKVEFSLNASIDDEIDDSKDEWTWGDLRCVLPNGVDNTLDGVTHISVTYKTDSDAASLVLTQATFTGGESYRVTLPNTSGSFSTETFAISDFAQPEWAPLTANLDLAMIDTLTFTVEGSVGADETSFMYVSELLLYNYQGSETVTTPIYPISASVDGNGTIDPSGVTMVEEGSGQAYRVTPTSGYRTDSILVNNVKIASITDHTFAAITSGQSIKAFFSLIPVGTQTYKVTPIAVGNGSISPNIETVVDGGDDLPFTFSASNDSQLDSVLVGASKVTLSGDSYTIPTINSDKTITAYYSIKKFTITSSETGTGTITATATVDYNGSKTFYITPASDYEIIDVKVDGISEGIVTSYEFTNVISIRTISAEFGPIEGVIVFPSTNLIEWADWSVHIDDFGTSTMDTTPTVIDNSVASASFHIAKAVASSDTWTWGNIQAALPKGPNNNLSGMDSIKVTYSSDTPVNFVLNQPDLAGDGTSYMIELPAGDNQTVAYVEGDFAQPTWFTEESGYTPTDIDLSKIDTLSFSFDGKEAGAFDAELSISSIIVFRYGGIEEAYTSTINASIYGGDGTISPKGDYTISADGDVEVIWTEDIEFEFAPTTGNMFDSLLVDGQKTDDLETYFFSEVITDHNVVAYFSEIHIPETTTVTSTRETSGVYDSIGSIVDLVNELTFDTTRTTTTIPVTADTLFTIIDSLEDGVKFNFSEDTTTITRVPGAPVPTVVVKGFIKVDSTHNYTYSQFDTEARVVEENLDTTLTTTTYDVERDSLAMVRDSMMGGISIVITTPFVIIEDTSFVSKVDTTLLYDKSVALIKQKEYSKLDIVITNRVWEVGSDEIPTIIWRDRAVSIERAEIKLFDAVGNTLIEKVVDKSEILSGTTSIELRGRVSGSGAYLLIIRGYSRDGSVKLFKETIGVKK
jgi:hypothetical protein